MTLRPIRGMLCVGFLVCTGAISGRSFPGSLSTRWLSSPWWTSIASVSRRPLSTSSLKQDASDSCGRGSIAGSTAKPAFASYSLRSRTRSITPLFGVSRRVYIGLNGMLFSRLYTDLRLEIERIPETEYYALERSFVELSRVVRDKGAKLVVVMTPDKSAIYPEFLPSNMPILPTAGRLEKLREFLGRQPDILFVDADMLIRQSKRNDILMFAKTDLHTTTLRKRPPLSFRRSFDGWRSPGSEAGRRLSRRIQMGVERAARGGIDARFLGIIRPITEMYESPIPIYLIGSDHSEDGEWITKDPRGVFDWEFVGPSGDLRKQAARNAVVRRPSFSDLWWALGMHKYFCSRSGGLATNQTQTTTDFGNM